MKTKEALIQELWEIRENDNLRLETSITQLKQLLGEKSISEKWIKDLRNIVKELTILSDSFTDRYISSLKHHHLID